MTRPSSSCLENTFRNKNSTGLLRKSLPEFTCCHWEAFLNTLSGLPCSHTSLVLATKITKGNFPSTAILHIFENHSGNLNKVFWLQIRYGNDANTIWVPEVHWSLNSKAACKVRTAILHPICNVNLPIPEFAPVIIATFPLKSRPWSISIAVLFPSYFCLGVGFTGLSSTVKASLGSRYVVLLFMWLQKNTKTQLLGSFSTLLRTIPADYWNF